MTRLGLSVVVLAAVCACSPGVRAQAAPAAAVASQVPITVAEVVSGGTWTDGSANGVFRTITVQVPGNPQDRNTQDRNLQDQSGDEIAQVFLQWVGSRTPIDPVELIQSVPVIEFNDLRMTSASVGFEAEGEGQVRVTITSQEESDEKPPVTVVLVATTPGHYKINSVGAGSPADTHATPR